MKKILATLSLFVLLWSEITATFSFAYADNEESIVYEEQQEGITLPEENNEEVFDEVIQSEDNLDEEETREANNQLNTEVNDVELTDVEESNSEIIDNEEWWDSEKTSDQISEEIENLVEEWKNEILDVEDFISQNYQLWISEDDEYVPWEVIVKYIDEVPQETTFKALAYSESLIRNIFDYHADEVSLIANDLEIVEQLDSENTTVLIEIKDDKTVDETIELLQEDPRIEYVQPNYIYKIPETFIESVNDLAVSDTLKNQQWNLDKIEWENAYSIYSWYIKSSYPVTVWIIDNGVNYFHPDLDDSMRNPSSCKLNWNKIECEHGYDFLYNRSTPLPNISSHWTHIAWIIAAEIDNGTGIIGINPHSKIASLKAGNWAALTSSAVLNAIKFAIENDIKVINASFWSSAYSDIEMNSIKDFWEQGGLFIAAAGNEKINIDKDNESKIYPCAYELDNIICVASVSNGDTLSYFSNYWKTSVDIAAPWESILSTAIDAEATSPTLEENFESCSQEWVTLTDWEWWSCWQWNDNTYAYKFTNTVNSKSVDLLNHDNVYLSLAVACTTREWVNIDVEYTNDGLTYTPWVKISSVSTMAYKYTIGIEDSYYNDNFSFRLKVENPSPNLYCVIDEISLYQDPYYAKNSNRYVKMSGTSMATPHVSALASLVWMLNPNLSNIEVKNIILWTGDDINNLKETTVTWRRINVLKTLNNVKMDSLAKPEGLISSWNWQLWWNPIWWIDIQYAYEVLDSWNNIVYSWKTTENSINISEFKTGSYERRVKAFNTIQSWEYNTGYVCKKPVLNTHNVSNRECSTLTWLVEYEDDKCSNWYTLVWKENNELTGNTAYSDKPWTKTRKVYIENSFWETTDSIDIVYSWNNSPVILWKSSIDYPTTITSTSTQTIWNVIDMFWATDGLCWSGEVRAKTVSCTKWEWSLSSNVLTVKAPSSSDGTIVCTIQFIDDEWSITNGSFTYKYNTKITTSNNNSSSNNSSSNNSSSNNSSSNNSSSNNSSSNNSPSNNSSSNNSSSNKSSTNNTPSNNTKTQKSSDTSNKSVELQKPRDLILFSAPTNNLDFSRYNHSEPTEVLSNSYTVEMNNAYEFAHRIWITSADAIENANMWGDLTRIAMAKMLSQYAINILWLRPDSSKIVEFDDVSEEINEKYNNWAILAYQLWIMWIWIKNFRPYDTVTRAEFATSLSRMLFWLKDGNESYYTTHINKLRQEWIINNTNPNLQEIRWYVMLMLMRSAMKNDVR